MRSEHTEFYTEFSADRGRLYQAVLRHDLSSFIARSFYSLNPGRCYLPNWHIDAIADMLSACSTGDVTRLMINMPPRMLKSMSVTIAWPAWLLGRDASHRIITASYSSRLAVRHALDCRHLLLSDWYKKLFPSTCVEVGQNEKQRVATTAHGFRLATSVGGTMTGDGGDIVIIDDPLNPRQAASQRWRKQVNHWFDHTVMSRLDNPSKGVIVIVMQRLHEQDLCGYLLSQSSYDWHHLILPVEAPERLVIPANRRPYVMEAGELLHQDRLSPEHIAMLRTQLGSAAFNAQYLQQPLPEDGAALVRRAWFARFTSVPVCPDMIVHSWDTAYGVGSDADYSVGVVVYVVDHQWYVVDVHRARLDYTSLRQAVLHLASSHSADAVLIERKASGQSILQELSGSTTLPLIPIVPQGDKLSRLARISPMIEAGRVWLPERAPWLAAFEDELLRFPDAAFDDQVDAFSQVIQWLHQRGMKGPSLRLL